MRKRIIISISLSLLILLNIFNSLKVEAYTPIPYKTFNDHRLAGGVGNYGSYTRYYYISATNYSSDINAAMNGWIYTTARLNITTPISFRRTYTKSSSVMDIYSDYYNHYPYNNANGWTEFWTSQSMVDEYQQDWSWNKIYINLYNSSGLTSEKFQGVIAHEMGHCFGLNENNDNPYTIMCQSAYERQVQLPTDMDLGGINYLY